MRRIFVLILAVLMLAGLVSLAACGKKAADTEPAEGTLAGGWQRTESPEVTEEVQEKLELAASKLMGAKYIPVACVGRQVVSGTNYLLICRVSPVVPDAEEHWAVVTLYANLEGEAEITDVRDFPGETYLGDEGLAGGWSQPESPELTEDARKAFDKATEALLGVKYEPLALLSTQLVSGTNYCFLCEGTTLTPSAPTTLYLMTVYANLQGQAEVLEITVIETEDTAE